MKFLPSFFAKKKQKDFFIALVISPTKVTALLAQEFHKVLTVVATEEETLPDSSDTVSEDSFIEAADHAITSAEEAFLKDTFVQKTIFGVPYHWVDEGKIKREYLSKLKKLCDVLELTPIGFLIPIEALVHLLQKKEGAPVSGIFVEFAKDSMTIFLVRAGNIIEVKSASVEKSFISTVEKLLASVERFEVLPPRMILLDFEGIEMIQQEFLSHSWTEDLPFLHLPAVSVIEKEFNEQAVIQGFATEMGFEVLDQIEEVESEQEELKEEKEEVGKEYKEEFTPGTFGFSMEETSNIQQVHEADVSQGSFPHHKKRSFSLPFSVAALKEIFDVRWIMEQVRRLFFSILRAFRSTRKGFVFVPLGIVFVLIIFSFLYFYLILKAEVIVFLDKKVVDKRSQVFLVSDQKTNISGLVLPAATLEIAKEGSSQKTTSGKKEVGDKAKGEVVVYNKTEQKKIFSKGTSLVGPNNLKFVFGNEVTVASTSAFSTTLSSSKAGIEAAQFGPEYNFPSNTNFTFSDFPTTSYFAKNESAFSGGTKKEISTVSKKDMENLLSQTIEKLRSDVVSQVQQQGDKDMVIIPETMSEDVIEKKYNKKEGDEADKISASFKIKFSFLQYSKRELDDLVREVAKTESISSYAFVREQSKIEMRDIKKEKDNIAHASLLIHLVYLPALDENTLKVEIKGKTVEDAEEVLHKLSGVSEAKIVLKNQLPILPVFLPLNKENITFVKKTNG